MPIVWSLEKFALLFNQYNQLMRSIAITVCGYGDVLTSQQSQLFGFVQSASQNPS